MCVQPKQNPLSWNIHPVLVVLSGCWWLGWLVESEEVHMKYTPRSPSLNVADIFISVSCGHVEKS